MNRHKKKGAARAPAWPNVAAPRPLPAQIEALLALAIREVRSDREQAVHRLEQAVSDARAIDDPEVLVRTLHEAAVTLQQARLPDRAFILCLEAQPMLESLDDAWLALRLVLLRGTCYLDVGQHDRARQLIAEASSGFTGLGDLTMVGRCHAAMARACGLAGDLHAAVDHVEKAAQCLDVASIDAESRRRWLDDEAHWHLLLGRQLAAAGDHEQARAQWQRAASALPDPLERQPDEQEVINVTLLDSAVGVFSALGDLPRCRRALGQLVHAARGSRFAADKGIAWMRLAEFHVSRGSRSRATACARRAARCLPSSSPGPNRLMAQFLLAQLLEADGDFKGAYAAHCEASTIETMLDKETVSMRAELLALDLDAEQEHRQSAQTLQYAQRLSKVGQMVASITHDMNQPMASIKMLAETSIEMIGIDPSAQVRADILVMGDSCTRLVDLICQLPTFESRTGSQTSRVDINHAVDRALSIVNARLSRTRCDVVRELPPVEVQAAPDRLVSVLAQLLNNALDAMQAQTTQRLRLHARCEGHLLKLHVEDTGPGLSALAIERLFQPFSSTQPNRLGLGLALSRDALRDMNGDLTVVHQQAGGAVFCVELPLAAS
jgi:signal transduction histidine kinase